MITSGNLVSPVITCFLRYIRLDIYVDFVWVSIAFKLMRAYYLRCFLNLLKIISYTPCKSKNSLELSPQSRKQKKAAITLGTEKPQTLRAETPRYIIIQPTKSLISSTLKIATASPAPPPHLRVKKKRIFEFREVWVSGENWIKTGRLRLGPPLFGRLFASFGRIYLYICVIHMAAEHVILPSGLLFFLPRIRLILGLLGLSTRCLLRDWIYLWGWFGL